MIISRLRISKQSKVKSLQGMQLCSLLLEVKEHLIDLKRVKVRLRVNTAHLVSILNS